LPHSQTDGFPDIRATLDFLIEQTNGAIPWDFRQTRDASSAKLSRWGLDYPQHHHAGSGIAAMHFAAWAGPQSVTHGAWEEDMMEAAVTP
jgi:hypothetical protein